MSWFLSGRLGQVLRYIWSFPKSKFLSFAIILLRKRELITLHKLCPCCCVGCLSSVPSPWVGLWFMNVVFPGNSNLFNGVFSSFNAISIYTAGKYLKEPFIAKHWRKLVTRGDSPVLNASLLSTIAFQKHEVYTFLSINLCITYICQFCADCKMGRANINIYSGTFHYILFEEEKVLQEHTIGDKRS